jgi:small subunit ribosomal protein S20
LANAPKKTGNKDQAQQALKQAIRALDKAAAKGVIKKNNAARRKARLMKKFNQLQTA